MLIENNKLGNCPTYTETRKAATRRVHAAKNNANDGAQDCHTKDDKEDDETPRGRWLAACVGLVDHGGDAA